jgi:hypothetical protein
MSTHQHLTASAGYDTSSPDAISQGRTTIIAVALGLAAAAEAAVLLWNPWPARDDLSYDAVAPVRDDTWLGITIDALGFGTMAVMLGLAVCVLVRARGSRWANAGAVLASLGGVLYAMGAFAFAAFSWYATETDAISAKAGTALMEHAEDNPEHILLPQMAGFLLVTLALVAISVALLRARTTPTWLPVSILVLTAAQFTPVPGRVLDLVQAALMALFVVLAVVLLQRTRAADGQLVH